jgi:lysophospholipase L1-like esterase
LDRSVINMGFSGSGTMDLEVGRFLAELDASVILVDCLPNMTAEQVTARTVPLVNLLRATRPDVPLVLVEDRSYSNSWLIPSQRERNETSRSALRREWERLLQSGVERLSYVDGDALLGIDREGTTDGSHPSDLGFVQHADALEPILRDALAHSEK